MSAPDAVPRARRLSAVLGLAELRTALGWETPAEGVWTPDFVVLCCLVVPTVVFGRIFSKVRLVPGEPVYVTELAILLLAVLAIWRLGVRGAWARLRTTVPLVPLAVLWIAGAIATLRGLHSFGLRQVQPDIGLIEYSVFVPLVALVVDSRARLVRLFALVLGGAAVLVILYGILYWSDSFGWYLSNEPGVAIALYISFLVVFVLARLASKAPVMLLELVFVGAGLVLVSLTTARAAVAALLAALVSLVVTAPAGRRTLMALVGVAALGLSVGGALLVEKAQPQTEILYAPPPVAIGQGFVADDGGSAFTGGVPARDDGARGTQSRRLELDERYQVVLAGLAPGRLYTVTFAVKPLSSTITGGVVGDPTGLGWGQRYWATAPVERWQFFRRTFRATLTSETVGLVAQTGSPYVLFDAVRVVPAKRSVSSGGFVPQRAVVHPGFVSDDLASAFTGGTNVVGDAIRGRYARKVALDERLDLPKLIGLRPGRRYTVSFAVKPLAGRVTTGLVGDPTGLHWGQRYWRTIARRKWQAFQLTLRATAGFEELAIVPQSGSPEVLIDAIRVTLGRSPAASAALVGPPDTGVAQPASDRLVASGPPPPPSRPPGTTSKKTVPLQDDLGDLFGGSSASGQNVEWRVAIWRYMLRQTLHHPVFGVGFGTPTDFKWRGNVYDARSGSPSEPTYSTPPHNSFVNILYRTGLLGFLALLALVAIALLRVFRAVRASDLEPLDRSFLASSLAIFVLIAITACFSVALEGPYMGAFFWIFLALLLVAPRLAADGRRRGS